MALAVPGVRRRNAAFRVRALLLAILLAQAWAPAAPAQPSPAAQQRVSVREESGAARAPVAYEIPFGQMLFRARVAGREVWAVLDTGA